MSASLLEVVDALDCVICHGDLELIKDDGFWFRAKCTDCGAVRKMTRRKAQTLGFDIEVDL